MLRHTFLWNHASPALYRTPRTVTTSTAPHSFRNMATVICRIRFGRRALKAVRVAQRGRPTRFPLRTQQLQQQMLLYQASVGRTPTRFFCLLPQAESSKLPSPSSLLALRLPPSAILPHPIPIPLRMTFLITCVSRSSRQL